MSIYNYDFNVVCELSSLLHSHANSVWLRRKSLRDKGFDEFSYEPNFGCWSKFAFRRFFNYCYKKNFRKAVKEYGNIGNGNTVIPTDRRELLSAAPRVWESP